MIVRTLFKVLITGVGLRENPSSCQSKKKIECDALNTSQYKVTRLQTNSAATRASSFTTRRFFLRHTHITTPLIYIRLRRESVNRSEMFYFQYHLADDDDDSVVVRDAVTADVSHCWLVSATGGRTHVPTGPCRVLSDPNSHA